MCDAVCAPVDMDFSGSIEEFFQKDEFASMYYLEKQRYSNLRMNYEMLLHYGFSVEKPYFMKSSHAKKKMINDAFNSDSDEEWKPHRKSVSKAWRPPYRSSALNNQRGDQCSEQTKCNTKKEHYNMINKPLSLTKNYNVMSNNYTY